MLPWQDRARGPLVAETVVLLNQAMRYGEAQQLAAATLSDNLSPQEEADVRLGLSMLSPRPAGQRAEENRRALELDSIGDLTRTRHLGWLAYNLAMDGQAAMSALPSRTRGRSRRQPTDTLTKVLAEVSLALVNCADGYTARTEESLERLAVLTRSAEPGAVQHFAAINRAILLVTLGQLDEATASVSESLRLARAQRNQMAIQLLTQIQALIQWRAAGWTGAGHRRVASPAGTNGVDTHRRPDRTDDAGPGGRHTNDRSLLRDVASMPAMHMRREGPPTGGRHGGSCACGVAAR